MNALTYALNPQVATPSARDPIAGLLARAVGLAVKLGGRRLATRAAYRADFGFVVTQDDAESATDVAEPSTAELLARLAALRENIRRARQHYGIDDRNSPDGDAGASSGEAAKA